MPLGEWNQKPDQAATSYRLDWHYFGALALLLMIPLSTGLFRLSLPSIWNDEAASWHNVSRDWRAYWTEVIAGEDCGGFFYSLFLKFWVGIFGDGEFALRFPSVLFAMGTVAALLHIGCELQGLPAGFFMALFGGCHPEVILWSRQARAYGLEFFLAALCFQAALAYGRTGERKHAVFLGCVACLLSLTHIFGVFAVVGAGCYLTGLRFWSNSAIASKTFLQTLWPTFIPVVCLAPWVFVMRNRVIQNVNDFWIDDPIAFSYFQTTLMFGIPLLIAGGAIWGFRRILLRHASPDERRMLLATACFETAILAAPLLASVFSRGDHHFILGRYLFPGILPLVVIAGYYWALLPIRHTYPLALLLCAVSFWIHDTPHCYGEEAYDKSNTRAAVTYLTPKLQVDDQVLVIPYHERLVLRYYGLANESAYSVPSPRNGQSLVELLRSESSLCGTRKWLFLYGRRIDDDLRDLGLQAAPQTSFGSLRLVSLDTKSANPPPK